METIVLDPVEEVPGRVEFDLTPFVAFQGPDWGDATTEPYRAPGTVGEQVLGYRISNRTVSVPLVVRDGASVSFGELRSLLQAKVALWQRSGGWVKRVTTVGPVFARIVTASLKLGGSTAQAMFDVDVDAVLTLELHPEWLGEWRGDPENGGDGVTGDGEVIRVLGSVAGDHAAHTRITVTDESGVTDRNAVIWGVRYHDATATAALAYDAAELTPRDQASLQSAVGSIASSVVLHPGVSSNWTAVLRTDLVASGDDLTHTGSYRVWARVRTTRSTLRLRLRWSVGSMAPGSTNTPVAAPSLPTGDQWFRVDLGTINIRRASPGGVHSWRGLVEAIGETGNNESVSIDRIWFQPLDESAGTLRSTWAGFGSSGADFLVRDEFNQTAGALNGKTAAVGGNWATSGVTGDFAVETTGKTITRSTSADSSFSGRFARLGPSNLSTVVVRADMKRSSVPSSPANNLHGVICRWVDEDNYASADFLSHGSDPTILLLSVVVGGTGGAIFGEVASSVRGVSFVPGAWYTVQLAVDAAGRMFAWTAPAGSPLGEPLLVAQHSALATGGALATGAVGIRDMGMDTTVRNYDKFAAWQPSPEGVIRGPLLMTTDGMTRSETAGGTPGRVPWVSGDNPRLPASSAEGLPVEVMVLASGGDLGRAPDASPAAEIGVKVEHRPSYLYVPDSTHGGPGS